MMRLIINAVFSANHAFNLFNSDLDIGISLERTVIVVLFSFALR